jgi:hypothetical protein
MTMTADELLAEPGQLALSPEEFDEEFGELGSHGDG